jgi:hypothetical protein
MPNRICKRNSNPTIMNQEDKLLQKTIMELKLASPILQKPGVLTETILRNLTPSSERSRKTYPLLTALIHTAAIILIVFFCLEQTLRQPIRANKHSQESALLLTEYKQQAATFENDKPAVYLRKMHIRREKNQAFRKTYQLFKKIDL